MRTNNAIVHAFLTKENEKIYKKEILEKQTREKEELVTKRDKIKARLEAFDNLMYTCKLIIEKLTFNSKHKLEKFLTHAFQHIFTDRHYVIELALKEDTKKPGLELTLIENDKRQEITEAVGGGIISTLGLLLQIYYIEVYDLNKIMFIDEGLKEVSTGKSVSGQESPNYLENVLQFLKWLAKEKGYKFVIVTHDPQVRKFADKIYEVKNGKVEQCEALSQLHLQVS